MRTSKQIIDDINKFESVEGNWLKLDALLNELWSTNDQQDFTIDLLNVFERFPEEDGAGVFWSIIHGVEGFESYEQELIYSLNRQPSTMGLTMLGRIKNSGTKTIGKFEIKRLLADLLLNPKLTPTLKEWLIKIVA